MAAIPNFRKHLRLYLQLRGLTVSALSRQTDVPKQTIADWLAGTRPRNMEHVKRVADALGVSIVILFFGDGSVLPKDHEPIRTLRSVVKTSPAELRTFLKRFTEGSKLPATEASFLDDRCRAVHEGSFFFSHTDELMQIRGLSGHPVELSNSWHTVLGWSLAEIKRKHWFDLIHPGDWSVTLAAIEKFMLGDQPYGMCNHRLVHESGQLIRVNTLFFIELEVQLIFTLSRSGKGWRAHESKK